MKSCIIIPPSSFLDDDKVFPQLGPYYIKRFVEENSNHSVDVLDTPPFTNLEKYNVVGFSVTTPQFNYVDIILPKLNKNQITVLGGPHCKTYKIEHGKFNHVVTDDGCRPFLNILDGKEPGKASDETDQLPSRGDWLKDYKYLLDGNKTTVIITSRGCPNRCKFCFDGNTKIITSNCPNKKIKDIKIGDRVITWNNGKLEEGVVNNTFKREVPNYLKITLENNTVLKVTHEHPFYLKGDWVEAQHLKINDILHHITPLDEDTLIKKLFNFHTNGLKISKIEEVRESLNVYNFECDNNNYFAEYVLVHNCESAETSVRYKSIEAVKQEIQECVNLGFTGIMFFDDLFCANNKRVRELCSIIKPFNIKIRAFAHAKNFSEEMAKNLADAGCVEIGFGAEHVSQKILDIVDKKTKAEQNYKLIEIAHKYGIRVKSFLMIGLPGEDHETVKELEKFVLTSGVDDFDLTIFYPFVGTHIADNPELYDIQIEQTNSEAYYKGKLGDSTCTVRTSALSSADIKYWKDRIYAHNKRWRKT